MNKSQTNRIYFELEVVLEPTELDPVGDNELYVKSMRRITPGEYRAAMDAELVGYECRERLGHVDAEMVRRGLGEG